MNCPIDAGVCGDQQGFGLIEVLIALLLLSIAALGFLMVQSRALIVSADANFHTQAVQLMSNDYHATRSFSPAQKAIYAQTLTHIVRSADGGIASYHRAAHATNGNCHQSCTSDQLAQSLAIRSAQAAARSRIILSVVRCDTGSCWVAAWGSEAYALIDRCPNQAVRSVGDDLVNCIMMGGM